jgi:mannose-1-phosphate guanylyltransferase
MIIQAAIGTDAQQTQLELIDPQLEKISFDDAVVTKSDPEDAVVLSVDLGWADIGTWEALKEAVLSDPKENLIHGSVKTHDCQNNILYSYTDQMVAGIGIKDLTVVVTKDVIMVAPQSRIPDIKKLLAQFEGTPEERYT